MDDFECCTYEDRHEVLKSIKNFTINWNPPLIYGNEDISECLAYKYKKVLVNNVPIRIPCHCLLSFSVECMQNLESFSVEVCPECIYTCTAPFNSEKIPLFPTVLPLDLLPFCCPFLTLKFTGKIENLIVYGIKLNKSFYKKLEHTDSWLLHFNDEYYYMCQGYIDKYPKKYELIPVWYEVKVANKLK